MSLEDELNIPRKKKTQKKNVDNLKPFTKGSRTREEIVATASKGGIAKAKKDRRRKEIKEAMAEVLSLPAVGKVKDLLQMFGYGEEDLTNASAVAATLFVMAVRGDMKAMEMVLDYGFKVSDDDRKNRESEARISAMAKNGVDISVNSGDEDGSVMIYLPALEDEESAEDTEEIEGIEKLYKDNREDQE